MEVLTGLDNVLDSPYWVGPFFACVDGKALLGKVSRSLQNGHSTPAPNCVS